MAGQPSRPKPDRWRQIPAIIVGVIVFVLGLVLLRNGLTVAGEPLDELPPPAPAGAARLLTDQMVLIITLASLVAAAYLAALVVRRVLDDRWLKSLGPSGGVFDEQVVLDEDQSELIATLAQDVGELRDLQERRAMEAQQQFDDMETALLSIMEETSNPGGHAPARYHPDQTEEPS